MAFHLILGYNTGYFCRTFALGKAKMSVRDEDDRAIFWDDPILLMDDENLDNPPVELTHRSVQASSISNRDSAIESNFMSEKETAARSIPAYSPSQLSSSLSLISRTDQIASNTDRIGSFTSKPAFVTSISMPADDGFRSRTSDMTSPLISNSPKRSMFVKKTLKTNSIPVYKGAAILERRSASTQNVVMEEHIPLMLGSGNLPRELSGTSLSDSIMNSINILVGVGILISPYAISQTGWMGLGIMSLLCVLSCYSAILIGKCMDAKPGILTLIDLGKEAFGSGAEMIISLLIFLELFGALSIYIVLQVDSLEYALPNTLPRISWTVIVGCIILLTIWIGNLSDLSFLSIFGCFVNITVLFVALIYSGIITQVSPGSIANPSSTSYGIFDGIPLCVSFLMVISYCFFCLCLKYS